MGAGLNLTCSFWFMALTQEGSYPVFFFFLRTERITEACDAAGAVTSHFLPHEHSTVFPQMESSSSYFAPHCGQTMFIALSPCELPDGDLSCLKYHNLFQVQGEEQSFLLFDGIGEIGGPLRDAVELLPAEGAVHAGFGFGAEAAGGREFAQPPALIEFSPALRRLFHTENPLDFQYSAVSGTINRKYGLFCKNLAF